MQYSGGRFSSLKTYKWDMRLAPSALENIGKYWKWVGRSLHVPVIPVCSQHQRNHSANHRPTSIAVGESYAPQSI